jgi:hypothetical protein
MSDGEIEDILAQQGSLDEEGIDVLAAHHVEGRIERRRRTAHHRLDPNPKTARPFADLRDEQHRERISLIGQNCHPSEAEAAGILMRMQQRHE